MRKQQTHERGIALLITLLLMSVLLTISASLLNITLKQYQFSSIGVASEQAFQAANAGLECILWHDYDGYPPVPVTNPGKFDVEVMTSPAISCFGLPARTVEDDTLGATVAERRYRFSWSTDNTDPTIPEVCTDVTIYKFYNPSGPEDMEYALGRSGTCAEDVSCMVIRARGYNVACPAPGDNFPPRSIEREITQRY